MCESVRRELEAVQGTIDKEWRRRHIGLGQGGYEANYCITMWKASFNEWGGVAPAIATKLDLSWNLQSLFIQFTSMFCFMTLCYV